MNKRDEGYILIDTIVALLILSITLTSVYGLFIKSLDMEKRILKNTLIILDKSDVYYETIKHI